MTSNTSSSSTLSDALYLQLTEQLLKKWYPLVVDQKCGGYFTNLAYDWRLENDQEKMIVTQARHIWTTSKAAELVPTIDAYERCAYHGFAFVRDHMWDQRYGGFFQIRDRDGAYSDCRGWAEEKRTYGNAFAIFALASLFGLTHDNKVLDLATKAFDWLESRAFDPDYGGYFQFLTREGEPFDETSSYRSVASDAREVGLKDQNSSIHLLEAYTELVRIWPDERLKSKLASLLRLIRDTMVTKKGYLQLFFGRDWTPVTFRKVSEATRALNYDLDHVSFGHDYETAFLMIEASHVLGLREDARTLVVARQMLDHAIEHGWDSEFGGFFDGGYYHEGHEECTIVRKTKTWWSQAEALNALLLFSRIFPEDHRYQEYFNKEWEYVDKYLLDHKRGDWYEGGLDREPQAATGPKSQMWKCTYHTGRALMNSIALISDDSRLSSGFKKRRHELDALINHWRAQKLRTERTGNVTADTHTA